MVLALITIHREKETDFTKNGYGSIDEYIVDPEVTWEMNGEFRVDFEYPMFLDDSKYLINRNIVRVPVPFMQDQLFRIYRTRKTLGFIEVEARHIFYDLIDNLVEDTFIVDRNGQGAIQQLLNATQFVHKFEGLSNITNTANARMVRYNPVEALLDDGKANSFVSRWGGEILRDNFRINMLQEMGSNRGVHIEHKKDLLGYEATIDESTIATRIYPRGFDGLELPERYIDSPLLDSNHPKIKIINYSDVKAAVGEYADDEDAIPLEEALSLLRQYAEEEYTTHHIDEPETVVNVDFVTLNNTLEHEDLAGLQEVRQGDTVKVSVLDEGFEITSRLVAFKSDPLQKNHYTSTTLGNHVLEFTSSGETIDAVRRDLNEVRDTATRAQASANGKNRNFYGAHQPQNPMLGDTWFQFNGEETIMWQYIELNGEQFWHEIGNTADVDTLKEEMRINAQKVDEAQLAADDAKLAGIEAKAAGELAQIAADNALIAGNDARLAADDALVAGQHAQDQAQAAQAQAMTATQKADQSIVSINDAIVSAGFNSLADLTNNLRSISEIAQIDATEAITLAQNARSDAQAAQIRADTAVQDAKDALDAYTSLDPGTTNLIRGTSDEWRVANHSVYYAQIGRYSIESLGLLPGESIGFSVYVIAGSGVNARFRWEEGANNFQNDRGSYLPAETEGKISVTSVVPERATHLVLVIDNAINGFTFSSQYRKVMLVRGNKIGSWQPSPEDVQIEITRIDGQLQSKVSQEVFNTLDNTVQTISTVAYQNQTDIGFKADKSIVDTINQTVENHTVLINLNAEQLQFKASSDSVDLLNSTVSTLRNEFDFTAGQISSKIWQTDITSAIDSIDIDGQNLVANSNFGKGLSDWNYTGGANLTSEEGLNSINPVRLQSPVGTGDYIFNTTIPAEGIKLVSVWYKWESGQVPYLFATAGSNNLNTIRVTTIVPFEAGANIWKRAVFQADFDGVSTFPSIRYAGQAPATNVEGSILVDSIQIERGNKLTGWSPAVIDQISSIELVQSEFTQRADIFEQSIIQINSDLTGKAELAAFNSLTTTVDGSLQRIGTAEGRLNTVESTANGTQQNVFGPNGLSTQVTTIADGVNILARRSVQNLLTNPDFEDGLTNWSLGSEIIAGSSSGIGRVFEVWTANGQMNSNRRIWVSDTNLVNRQGKSYEIKITFHNGSGQNLRMTVGQTDGEYFESFIGNGNNPITRTFSLTLTGSNTLSLFFLDNGYYRIQEVVITETGGASQAQLSVLNNNINARVEVNDIVRQINISTEGILIDGGRTHITGQTTIDEAVIQTVHIADLAVNTAKIAMAAIHEAQIGNLAVATGKIANLAVTSTKVGNAAITNAKIANLAVTAAKIADASITEAKIGTAAIVTAHIGNAQITEAKIGNLQVTTAKIATAAITNAKILSLDVNKISGNTAEFVRLNFNSMNSNLEVDAQGLSINRNNGARNSRLSVNGYEFWNEGNEHGRMFILRALDATGTFSGKHSVSLAAESDAYVSLSYRGTGGSFTRALGVDGLTGKIYFSNIHPNANSDEGLQISSIASAGVRFRHIQAANLTGFDFHDNGDIVIPSGSDFIPSIIKPARGLNSGMSIVRGTVAGYDGIMFRHSNANAASIFFADNGYVYIRSTSGNMSLVTPNFN